MELSLQKGSKFAPLCFLKKCSLALFVCCLLGAKIYIFQALFVVFHFAIENGAVPLKKVL